MASFPKTRTGSIPKIYSDSNYGQNSSFNSSNKSMTTQFEKCWKEFANGKYNGLQRKDSTSSTAIEEEVRNMYDQVALQVRRGDSSSMSITGSQINSNYSRSEKSFIHQFRFSKKPATARSYGFSDISNSRILTSVQNSQLTNGNNNEKKINIISYQPPNENQQYIDNDKETIVPGIIFFIIGFLLFPFWWFASIIPLHPVTEREFKWRRNNRIASLISILLIITGLVLFFVFK